MMLPTLAHEGPDAELLLGHTSECYTDDRENRAQGLCYLKGGGCCLGLLLAITVADEAAATELPSGALSAPIINSYKGVGPRYCYCTRFHHSFVDQTARVTEVTESCVKTSTTLRRMNPLSTSCA